MLDKARKGSLARWHRAFSIRGSLPPVSSSFTHPDDSLQSLRVIRPDDKSHRRGSRGSCDSCGLCFLSECEYRVLGLRGLFCSLVCIECAIAGKTGQTKIIPGAPIGNGARLLAYLKTEAPHVYAKLADKSAGPRCKECGVSLDGKRADSEFCSGAHSKRYRRRGKSSTTQKCGISPDTPIGKQGLTDAQNSGSMDILALPTRELETSSATSVFPEAPA